MAAEALEHRPEAQGEDASLSQSVVYHYDAVTSISLYEVNDRSLWSDVASEPPG